jgi:hypothetical protein
MFKEGHKGVPVRRRDFLKTTTIASMVATLPGTSLLSQDAEKPLKSNPAGTKRKLLLLSESPSAHERLIESIKSIKGIDLSVFTAKVDYQAPQEIVKSIKDKGADIVLMCLPGFTYSFGNFPTFMDGVDIPVILLSSNLDLLMVDGDLSGAIRARGVKVLFANSESHALELIKAVASPRILEGKRAFIYGRPFHSTSVPVFNLSEDSIYKRTGVKIQYRPIEELKSLLEGVKDAAAQKEMERWKKEAAKTLEASDKAIIDACRMYVLLRSIIDKEGLSAVSIDCLGFSFDPDPILPHPCLSFTRLRDEGIAAACEADVCGMLSMMLMQEVSRRSSFMSNVSSVNRQQL